jgi:hypothetical protein
MACVGLETKVNKFEEENERVVLYKLEMVVKRRSNKENGVEKKGGYIKSVPSKCVEWTDGRHLLRNS